MTDEKIGKCTECKKSVNAGESVYCDMNHCYTKLITAGDALYANKWRFIFAVDKDGHCDQWEMKQ